MAITRAVDDARGPTRVLAVDAHPVVLGGIGAIIAGRDDLELVGVATCVPSARTLIAERAFDVAVVGLDLPGRTALRLVEEIRWRRREARVVVLASSLVSPMCTGAVALGASAVERTEGGQALVEAILEPDRSRSVRFMAAGDHAAFLLTPRQGEIVALLLDGRSNDEIAGALGTKAKTVETHLSRLYRRFGVQGRMELAMLAVRSGRLPPTDPSREGPV